jgi:gliding motility-associated-like protein
LKTDKTKYQNLALALLCLFLSFSELSAQCDADAGPTSVQTCAGTGIQIGGNPTAINPTGAVTYNWTPAAGLTGATTANPTANPTLTTIYTVTLSGGGCDGQTDQITVNVSPAPNASFTFSPNNTPCANVPIQFTNTTGVCAGCTYEWDFGDGSPISTLTSPSHTFSTATGTGNANYTVTLTVTGANSCEDIFTASVAVRRIPDINLTDPISSFTQCSGAGTFTMSVFEEVTNTGATNFSIDWGDGTPGWSGATSPAGVSHTYNGNDVFELVYSATGANGCTASETHLVSNITNPSIGAANPGGTQGCGPLTICFPLNNYDANHESTTYLVDFGDGSPTQLLNHPPPTEICHSYSGSSCATNPAGYTFSITANNNCDQSVATIFPVKVYSAPVAAFTPTPVPACVNSTVTFINNSIPGYNNSCAQTGTYAWNFGDGSPVVTAVNLNSQTHVYTTPGTYTVTLTATNACGNSSDSHEVCIEPAPTPIFTVNDNDGCFPMAVITDNTSTSPQSCGTSTAWIVDYSDLPCDPDNGTFSFTNGTSASSLEPQFSLTSVGIYTLRLRMTNSCGTFEDAETITVNTTPIVDVTTPNSVCVGTTGTPSAIVDGCNLPVTAYAWTFTGGTPASANTLAAPAISYPSANNYTVTLTATNACGSSSDSGTMQVLAAPDVQITAANNDNGICNGQSTILTASGAGSYTWSPSSYLSNYSGTGNTVQSNPTAAVTYTVTGTSGSCTDTGTISLTIDPLPNVSPSGTFEMCEGQTEQLGLTVSGGSGTYTSYSWTPATGLNNSGIANPTSNITFDQNYTVTVTDNLGCIGTSLVSVNVNPLPPTYAGPDINLCNQPVATTLTGQTPTTGGTGPGGGGSWSGNNVTSAGVFTPGGVGNITLTYCFTNATTGCTACDDMIITVSNPTGANAGPDTTICSNANPIQLPAGTWTGSPNISPTGLYTPTSAMVDDVIVTQGNGSCATTDTTIVTILPVPIANAGPDVTICAGESVDLDGTCVNCPNGPASFCSWTGGPSAPALSCSPSTGPLFMTTTYNLTLVDVAGCADPDQITIFVNPLPNTNAGLDLTVCNQPIATQLNGSPAGGTWTGTGITAGGAFTPTGTGIVTLTYCFTDPNTNCEYCDDVVVTVVNPTVADAGANIEVCQNQPVFNLATTTPGGTWSAGAGVPITSGGAFTPSATGVYNITYTLGSGTCLTSDVMQITVNELPTVELGADEIICVGDSVQLNATINNGQLPYTIDWNFATWLSDDDIINPIAFPPSNVTFTASVTDQNQCIASDAITVIVNGLPVVEAGNNLTLCDQPIEEVLTGFSPTINGTGTWYGSGITDADGTFVSPGVGSYWIYYEFTAGGNACANTDSIQITVNPPVLANAGPDVSLCLNNGVYQLTGFNPPTGGVWSGVGVADPLIGLIDPEDAGSGSWTITIENGSGTCYTSDDMTLDIIALPIVDSGPGAVVCGNAAIFDLQDFVPSSGGTWEGIGITNPSAGTFDPESGTGEYNIFYWYEDPATGCIDTSYTTVNVSPVPVANFALPVMGCTNAPVNYTNLSVGATNYNWNYGNGDELTGFEPVYTYPAPAEGVFDITLIATNAFGCADTASNSNEIINPPAADMVVAPANGCAPLEVFFDNQTVGQYLAFSWDLDTSTSSDSIPSSVIYQQGNDVVVYDISLTAENFCGTDTDQDEVTVLPQPIAGFGTNLDEDCSPFEVLFNNISEGLPETFEWDFGDGTGSTEEEPFQHVFYADTIAVDYTIWLYLSNECGLDTASYTITVLPNTVTSFFNTNITEGCEPLEVEFTDYSDGANSISYNLGDGNLTGNDNPVHIYDEGFYTIFQYADNGCSYDTSSITIEVYPSPVLDFSTNIPNMCTNNEVQFISEFENAVEFTWDFGDGSGSDLSSPIHEYTEGGNYTVTFSAENTNGCEATVSHPFIVFDGPAASFTVPDALGCSPFNLCFSNTAIDGNFYSWDFGDGNTSVSEDACNTYTNIGNQAALYNVSLIVQDLQLCADTFTMEIIVAPQPASAFTLSGFESCYYPQAVTTTNISQFANGFEWFLDGESYADITNTDFLFSAEGEYEISLLATNQFGCNDISQANYNIYPLPTAMFSAEPQEGCVPLTVSFNNESTGATSYFWDLGNGSTSSSDSPTLTYFTHGLYDVSLVAITDAGCSDTLNVADYVRAYRNPIADFWMDPSETDIYSPEVLFYEDCLYASQYDWNFGDGGSSVMPNVAHTFPGPGTWTITLTVSTNNGCEDQVQKQVVVNDIFNLYVPNAFTPDADGINEVFLPRLTGIPFMETYKFEIFDRWGTIIFSTNDPEEAWTGAVRDGKYFAKDEAYNWQITVQLKGSDKERVYSGHVILVR